MADHHETSADAHGGPHGDVEMGTPSSSLSTPVKRLSLSGAPDADAYATTSCASSASSSAAHTPARRARPSTPSQSSPARSPTTSTGSRALDPFIVLQTARNSFVCILRRASGPGVQAKGFKGRSDAPTTGRTAIQGYLCMREVQSKLLDALSQYRNRTEQSSRSSIRQELEKLHYIPLTADKGEIAILKSRKVIKHNAPGTSLYSVAQVAHFLHYHNLDTEAAQLQHEFDAWCEARGYDVADASVAGISAASSEAESEGARDRKKKVVLRVKTDTTTTATARSPAKARAKKIGFGRKRSSDEEELELEDEADEDFAPEDEEVLSLTHAPTPRKAKARPARAPRRVKTKPVPQESDETEDDDPSADDDDAYEPEPPVQHSSGHRRQRSHSQTQSQTHTRRPSRGQGAAGGIQVHEFEHQVDDVPPSFSAPPPRAGSGWERYHQRMNSQQWKGGLVNGNGAFNFGGAHLQLPGNHHHMGGHHREASLLPSGLELEAMHAREARIWAEAQYQNHAPAPLPIPMPNLNPMIKLVMSPVSMQLATARSVMSPTSPLPVMGPALSLSPFGIFSPFSPSHDPWAAAAAHSTSINAVANTASAATSSSNGGNAYSNAGNFKRPRLLSPSSTSAAYHASVCGSTRASPPPMSSSPPPLHHTTTTTTTTTTTHCPPGCQCHLHAHVVTNRLPPQHPHSHHHAQHSPINTPPQQLAPTQAPSHPVHVVTHPPPPPPPPHQSPPVPASSLPPPPVRRRSLSLPDLSEFQRLSESTASDMLVQMQQFQTTIR